ncbi:CEN-like protein 1 [Dichotomopilus funicola]|uniref:CEN-like protein 1 n=1 Tax=Dichotomopilus funicola TaxID=1934379 RepID=A0AAN6V2X5_9PEZI|nr:CEN-like protein 1 [Dichotomopilus funicola]
MFSHCIVVLLAATTAVAKTPDGFSPPSDKDLVVEYNGVTPLNGVSVSKRVTATQPRIGTLEPLNGTSYAVIMIDLDIPTNNPPETSTLLHWLQTDLVPAPAATLLNTTSGTAIRAFLLQNRTDANTGAETARAVLAPYIGPSPPARVPLSHRYTQILVDTSDLTAGGSEALRAAVTGTAQRRGFDAPAVLKAAGLENKVVAGNSFNVTNAGPASGAGGANRTAPGGTNGAGPTQVVVPGAGSRVWPGSVVMAGLVGVGMVALGL